MKRTVLLIKQLIIIYNKVCTNNILGEGAPRPLSYDCLFVARKRERTYNSGDPVRPATRNETTEKKLQPVGQVFLLCSTIRLNWVFVR